MVTNSFLKEQPQSKQTSIAPSTRADVTGKAVYTTTTGKVTSSREEAEEDVKKYKSKKKRKSKSEPVEESQFAMQQPVSMQEPIAETVTKETTPVSRVRSLKQTSQQSFFKTPEMSIGPKATPKTVEELQKEKEKVESGILTKFYDTKPIYSEYGQGTQTGSKLVLRPEAQQAGISIPFTNKRLFQSKESKEYEAESERLKSIEQDIYYNTTGAKISKGISLTKSPEDKISPEQRMQTFVQEDRNKDIVFRELQKTQYEKERAAELIPESTGVIEAGILYGTSQFGIGEQAPATKVLGLSRKEKQLYKELQTYPVIFGETRQETSDKLQESLKAMPTTYFTDTRTLDISRTPEEKAKSSLIRGGVEDAITLAATAGIAAGATKLAATSPTAFKVVKAVDIIDDISDVYEVGSGIFNIATGNVGGSARNLGSIFTGNIVAGGTSKKIGKGIDFTPVAETKIEKKLFPVGSPVKTLGYDISAELDTTYEPSYQERRIAQQLPLLPKKARIGLVSKGPEFQGVIVETKRKPRESEEFVSAALGESTQAPDFGSTTFDRPGAVFETPGETQILRPMAKTETLTGYIKEGGQYKQVRRNIPREKVGEFIGEQKQTLRQMLASKKGSLYTTRPSVMPSVRPDVSVKEKLSVGFGIEPDLELKSKFTPSTSTRTRLDFKSKSRTFIIPEFTGTTKPSVTPELKADITPITEPSTAYDYTARTDYTSRFDSTVQPDVTPSLSITLTPTLRPKFDFTPRAMPFRIPRTPGGLRGRTRSVREFNVENKILDITKGFKRVKPITGKESTFNGKIKPIKGIGNNTISEKLKRLLS